MSREKQIEEMAREIEAMHHCEGYADDRGCYFANSCTACKSANTEKSTEMAKRLYNAGYRKLIAMEICSLMITESPIGWNFPNRRKENDMTERERLRELIYAWEFEESKVSIADCDTDKSFERLVDKLLAAGVIVPPCKVGDTVYKVIPKCSPPMGVCPYSGGYGTARCDKEPCETYIKEISFSLSNMKNICKTVFLTREDAEKALKECEGKT